MVPGLMANPNAQKMMYRVAIIIIVMIVLYIFYRLAAKIARDIKQRQQSNQSINASENAIVNNALTYAPSDYNAMADKVFRAMDGAGTDNDGILEVVSKLRTKSDWNALVSAFGIRETTAWYSRFKGNLIEWLADELSDNDSARKKINDVLDKFNVQV